MTIKTVPDSISDFKSEPTATSSSPTFTLGYRPSPIHASLFWIVPGPGVRHVVYGPETEPVMMSRSPELHTRTPWTNVTESLHPDANRGGISLQSWQASACSSPKAWSETCELYTDPKPQMSANTFGQFGLKTLYHYI